MEKLIKKHRKVLISTINGDEIIVEELYSQNIINERQYQQIKAEKVPIYSTEILLDALQHSEFNTFAKFCEILDSDYSWIANQLRSDAQMAGLNLTCNDTSVATDILLPFEKEDLIPSELELMRFSKTLVHDSWESVLYELGLRTSDIDQCKKSNPIVKMQCKYGLILWLRRNGKAATFQTLFSACKNVDVDRNCLSSLVNILTTM